MKNFLKKNRVCTVLFLMLFFGILASPVYGQEKTEEYIYAHTHKGSCYLMQVTNCEADGTSYGEITKRETCKLCGAELHHYRIQTKCSCGASFDDTGFACMNSPYGSNAGECSNYEAVGSTMHAHEEQVKICPYADNETVAKVAVYRSTTGMTREDVSLRLVMEQGGGSAYFVQNGLSELSVSENASINICIIYSDQFESKTSNESVSVRNIDRAAPSVSVQISPADWTEGNCVVSVQASDTSDGVNAVSGVAADGYSFDGGKTWGTETSKEFEDTIQSEIWIKDNAGNVTKQVFFAEKKAPPVKVPETSEERESESETLPEEAELPSEKKEVPKKSEEIPVENDAEEYSVTESPNTSLKAEIEQEQIVAFETRGEAEPVKKQTESAVSADTRTEEQLQETKESEQTKEGISFAGMYKRIIRWIKKPVVVFSISVTSILGGMLLLSGYFFLVGMGTIACVDLTGSEQFLAKIVVRRKRGKWRIEIGEDIAQILHQGLQALVAAHGTVHVQLRGRGVDHTAVVPAHVAQGHSLNGAAVLCELFGQHLLGLVHGDLIGIGKGVGKDLGYGVGRILVDDLAAQQLQHQLSVGEGGQGGHYVNGHTHDLLGSLQRTKDLQEHLNVVAVLAVDLIEGALILQVLAIGVGHTNVVGIVLKQHNVAGLEVAHVLSFAVHLVGGGAAAYGDTVQGVAVALTGIYGNVAGVAMMQGAAVLTGESIRR